jgi:hypothetical protein
VLSRLLSPAGFALVALLFLLPFVGVSCSAEELGSMDAEFTGFDLVTDADPTFRTDSPIADMVASDQGEVPTTGVTVPAVLVLVLLAAGIATVLLTRPRVHALAGGALAAVAAALLVITQLLAESNLVGEIRDNSLILEQSTGFDLGPVTTDAYLAEAVSSRIGFWFCLGVLVLVTGGNLLASVRSRAPAP